MSISSPIKNRLFALSNLEQNAIVRRQSAILNANFSNNEQFFIECDPLTTAEECLQRLLRQK